MFHQLVLNSQVIFSHRNDSNLKIYLNIHYIEMSDIDYIINFTSAVEIAAGGIPRWHTPLPAMPDYQPDECIIRSVSFNGSVAETDAYLVWSSIKNDFITSFCGGSIASFCPQTRIKLNSTLPNVITFTLYAPSIPVSGDLTVPAIIPVPELTNGGQLIIQMDFIKYKRTH
jgi:hypothetical protein